MSSRDPVAGRRGTLRRQLVLAFSLFALAILVATLVPFGVVSAHAHLATYIDQERADANRAAESLDGASAIAQQVRERYEGSDSAAWLLDARGMPVGEPTRPRAFPALVTRAPEIERARLGGIDHRIGDAPFGKRLFIAAPLLQDARLRGVLWVSAPLTPVASLNTRRWAALGAIGAAVLAAAAFVAVALSRRMTRRLDDVIEGARRFGSGQWDRPIPVRRPHEIAALATSLNEMASEIEAHVRREKDFVAAASHQIRTPLAAIRIRVDELLMHSDAWDAESVQYLKEMSDEVDRLTRLTTRLLDLSAAEGAQQIRPLVAGPAIRETIERVQPLAEHSRIGLHLEIADEGVRFSAPAGAFEEALFNVLENGVKFSPPGATVDVSARAQNGELVVEVADRGPGVPLEDRVRVFEPFYRATRARPGHGLGLAISSRLCESAGAFLALDRREGGGTLAVIRWPVEAT